jgi:hypothetical protein
MKLKNFIKKNRKEIDNIIQEILGPVSGVKLNDEERRQWIYNDESLYYWARQEGVKI